VSVSEAIASAGVLLQLSAQKTLWLGSTSAAHQLMQSCHANNAVFLQVLDVTQFMKYAVQSAAMFESRFNSVERILAYAKLKPEAPHHILGKQAPPEWPQAGAISYNNVVMKYRPELEPVLKVHYSICLLCRP
jgi:hypothetical protein